MSSELLETARRGLCRVIRGPEFEEGHYEDDGSDGLHYIKGPATGNIIVMGVGHRSKAEDIDAANAALDAVAQELEDLRFSLRVTEDALGEALDEVERLKSLLPRPKTSKPRRPLSR